MTKITYENLNDLTSILTVIDMFCENHNQVRSIEIRYAKECLRAHSDEDEIAIDYLCGIESLLSKAYEYILTVDSSEHPTHFVARKIEMALVAIRNMIAEEEKTRKKTLSAAR
jgi:hypothetical protein